MTTMNENPPITSMYRMLCDPRALGHKPFSKPHMYKEHGYWTVRYAYIILASGHSTLFTRAMNDVAESFAHKQNILIATNERLRETRAELIRGTEIAAGINHSK